MLSEPGIAADIDTDGTVIGTYPTLDTTRSLRDDMSGDKHLIAGFGGPGFSHRDFR